MRKPTRRTEVGRGERVLPGVWRLRLPLPWPGVPHCNAWALAAGDGVVLVDTGMHEPGSLAHLERALDQAGLRATSGHSGIPQPFDAAAWQATLDDARTIGQRYIVHPFFGVDADGPIRDSAVYRAFARDLNRAGLMAKRAGLEFGYHNHHFEFFRQDGGSRTGFEVLTDETDPDLVHLEVDLFWVTRGAHDPVDVIQRNRGRIRQFHVKDMNADGGFEDAGQGLIDFARIFRYGREAGIDEFIIERDDAGTPPRAPADAISTAEVGYDYLAALRF